MGIEVEASTKTEGLNKARRAFIGDLKSKESELMLELLIKSDPLAL